MLRLRPCDVLTHQRARMLAARLKCRVDTRRRRRVPQGHRNIPQPTFMPNPPNRAALQAFVEIGFGPGEQLDEGCGIEAVSRLKIRDRRALGKFVPRADELAVVAAVNAVAHRPAKFHRDRGFEFDGEIADAFARIESVRAGDGLGGADVDAGCARPAMVVLWLRRG